MGQRVISSVIRSQRLRWLGHVERMTEMRPIKVTQKDRGKEQAVGQKINGWMQFIKLNYGIKT